MGVSTNTFTIAANTDWHVQRAAGLGTEGWLVAGIYRLDTAGSPAAGSLEVKVTDRGYSSGINSATAGAIPDDEILYNETGIALTASATTAARTNIEATVGEAATYSEKTVVEPSQPQCPLLMVRGDGVLVGTVVVVLRSQRRGRVQ